MGGATVTQLVPRPSLTASTARQLTDSIKQDAEALFERLLNAYERGAHTALGYSSWSAYCKTEFNMNKARAYQLVEAGRVSKAIKTQSTTVDPPKSERVTRPLTPIRKQKGDKAVAEAWANVVEQHGPEPTAEEVEEVVRAMNPKPEPTRKLTRDQERFANNLSAMTLCAEYVIGTLGGKSNHATSKDDRAATKRLIDLDAETLAIWQAHVRVINAATQRLRRHVGPPTQGETT